ncbi:GNAT family N-acetyltransferase [Branchiibius cervicis]|uniref:GNAT family N-acetyltransferase n=1 Tax=Branchiibius cervicis TaxID=908252 RepID=A0ABW2AV93_9MICO
MTRPVLTTPRLELRPMLPEHLPLLVALDSDPEVMRYLLGRARSTQEAEEFWAPKCAETHCEDRGLGWFVGFADGEFVGRWDLTTPPEDTAADPEAGWRLRRKFWRQGLATEGAARLFDHGFRTVGVPRIWAETMAVNLGSRGVMRRLGMRHVRTEHRHWDDPLPGSEHGEVIYEILRDEWR